MTTYDHTLKIRLKDNQEKSPQQSQTGVLFILNLSCIKLLNQSKKINKSQLSSSSKPERCYNRKELNTKNTTENDINIFTTNGKLMLLFYLFQQDKPLRPR